MELNKWKGRKDIGVTRTRITEGILRYLKWDSPPEYTDLRTLKKKKHEANMLLEKFKKELETEETTGVPTKYDELLIKLLEKQFETIELAKTELDKAESLDSKFYYKFQDLIDSHNLLKAELSKRLEQCEYGYLQLEKSKTELLAQLSTLRWVGSLFFAATGLWISWLSIK